MEGLAEPRLPSAAPCPPWPRQVFLGSFPEERRRGAFCCLPRPPHTHALLHPVPPAALALYREGRSPSASPPPPRAVGVSIPLRAQSSPPQGRPNPPPHPRVERGQSLPAFSFSHRVGTSSPPRPFSLYGPPPSLRLPHPRAFGLAFASPLTTTATVRPCSWVACPRCLLSIFPREGKRKRTAGSGQILQGWSGWSIHKHSTWGEGVGRDGRLPGTEPGVSALECKEGSGGGSCWDWLLVASLVFLLP